MKTTRLGTHKIMGGGPDLYVHPPPAEYIFLDSQTTVLYRFGFTPQKACVPPVCPEPENDDHFLSELTAARGFIEAVRQAQFEKGRMGRSVVTRDQAIDFILTAENPLVNRVETSLPNDDRAGNWKVLQKLFQRFQGMCERNHMIVNDKMWPAITKLLAAELWTNVQLLGLMPDELVHVTVYHGDIGNIAQEDEFSGLQPGLFATAVKQRPSDPRGFLRRLQSGIAELSNAEEFSSLRKTPGVFVTAMVHNPTDPRTFLRKYMTSRSEDLPRGGRG